MRAESAEAGRGAFARLIDQLPKPVVAPIAAVASVAVTTVIGLALEEVVASRTILLLYLAPVIVSALLARRSAAVLAAGLGFLTYDFVFIEPRWTLAVAASDDFVALAVFLAVALITGALAAQRSEDAGRAEARAAAVKRLLEFSGRLAAVQGVDATLGVVAVQVGTALSARTTILAESGGVLTVVASSPPGFDLRPEELEIARAAGDSRKRTGAFTALLGKSAYMFIPIVTGRRLQAVLGLSVSARLDPQAENILAAMLDQAALAIDRAAKARESADAALLRESDKLQTALLSSLSHDFRTPLASITGAASSLLQLGEKMDAATRKDLLILIEEDAGRLNRFLVNLLDMTRIESGRLQVRHEAMDVAEIVGRARHRLAAAYPDFVAEISVAPDLPPAEGDPLLLEQVVFNLLDNSRKYGGSEAPVAVFARPDGATVLISVTDHGRGIPAADLERVFEKFYRRNTGDGRPAGTGLGLTIAREFVAAMGGTIWAESPAGKRRGTRVTIKLQRAAPP